MDVIAALFLNGPTKSVEALRRILSALRGEAETAPTHGNGSGDERKILPFVLEEIAAAAGTKPGYPLLWKQTPPQCRVMVDASPQPVARVLLRYEDIKGEHVAGVYAAIARLANQLRPVFGGVHFRWPKPTPEQAASMNGLFAKALEYSRNGIPGIFAWTWFGPALVDRIGEARLLESGGQRQEWGGVFLPLSEEPWAIPFEEVRSRQVEVSGALRKSGLFIDYSNTVPEKGAHWTPPSL